MYFMWRAWGTYANELVLRSGSQILAVRAKAHASNVEIAIEINIFVLKNADLLARLDIVDLSRSIASSRHVLAIGAKSHAANNTLMLQRVNQVDIEKTRNVLVENRPPVILHLLDMARQTFRV